MSTRSKFVIGIIGAILLILIFSQTIYPIYKKVQSVGKSNIGNMDKINKNIDDLSKPVH